MKNLKLYKSNVVLESNKIEHYDNLLSRFSNWKLYKREININTLLEPSRKIEFKVDIENQSFGGVYISLEEDKESDILLKNACAVIKSMTFIIKDSFVIDLEIEYKILETNKGEILSNMLKNFNFEINQKKLNGEVFGFYFSLPREAA